uniref:Uncharacterized protein n=1 Tax=viral metagenome TaxID=1070528 RepID=A0A6H2A546_9ZZZZ
MEHIMTVEDAQQNYIHTGQYIEVNGGIIGEIKNERIDMQLIDELKQISDRLRELATNSGMSIQISTAGKGRFITLFTDNEDYNIESNQNYWIQNLKNGIRETTGGGINVAAK